MPQKACRLSVLERPRKVDVSTWGAGLPLPVQAAKEAAATKAAADKAAADAIAKAAAEKAAADAAAALGVTAKSKLLERAKKQARTALNIQERVPSNDRVSEIYRWIIENKS